MQFLIKLFITAIAVLLASMLLPGVDVNGFLIALLVAAVLALLNGFVKPVLVLLTIPVTIVTLGLFLLVINALMVLLADWIVPGFSVSNFWWALIFSIIISLMVGLFEAIAVRSQKRPR